MKKTILFSLTLLMTSMAAHAQSVETIFTVKDTKDGTEVIDVQYRTVEPNFQIDTFAQADKNGDGCLDRTEAKDMGILNFDRFAVTKKGCLNEEEYLRAMHSAD